MVIFPRLESTGLSSGACSGRLRVRAWVRTGKTACMRNVPSRKKENRSPRKAVFVIGVESKV